MDAVRQLRIRSGYSQRRLAERALLSFRGVQLLEQEGHNWRVASLRKVAVAVGLPGKGIDLVLSHFLQQANDSVMMAYIRIVCDGPASRPLHLFNFVDAFRATRKEDLIRSAPVEAADPRTKALLTSTVETLCEELGIPVPAWCRATARLEEPWFVAGIESLKSMALVESPVHFRKRNIFVLANFLSRA